MAMRARRRFFILLLVAAGCLCSVYLLLHTSFTLTSTAVSRREKENTGKTGDSFTGKEGDRRTEDVNGVLPDTNEEKDVHHQHVHQHQTPLSSEEKVVHQHQTEPRREEEVPHVQTQTSDHWPVFSREYFPRPIPPSPFRPNFTIRWDFNTAEFLQRPDVKGQPPKLMTWMVKTRYMPPLPEPVRLRVCPEMPCRMTTNKDHRRDSSALLWAGQIMREPAPPPRDHSDQLLSAATTAARRRLGSEGQTQLVAGDNLGMGDNLGFYRRSVFHVFVFHNHEPQAPEWIYQPSFRKPAWRSAFNWTMHYREKLSLQDPTEDWLPFETLWNQSDSTDRFDADIVDLYGYLTKRNKPVHKNYTDIVAKKTKLAAWLVSHCSTHGQREKYVKLLRKYMPVDAYGGCVEKKCPRNKDDSCFKMINSEYKFYFAFENAFCEDYISEKFFRYLEADTVVVARGSNEYKNHAPSGIFINTADFNSTKELADYLLYLDSHPDEYIKLLKAKDEYQPLYEDWPIRSANGDIFYMHYHYEAVSYCEMCRRLWDLDKYQKTIPDIKKWFDKGNCYPPNDVK